MCTALLPNMWYSGFFLTNGADAGLGEEERKLKCSCQGTFVVSEVLCLHNFMLSKCEFKSGRTASPPQRTDVFVQPVSCLFLRCFEP